MYLCLLTNAPIRIIILFIKTRRAIILLFIGGTGSHPKSVQRVWFALFCIFFCLRPLSGEVADTLPYRDQILDTANLVNDYWISHNDSGNSGWARAAYYTGNQRLYELTGNPDYLEYAVEWGEANPWLRGPEGDYHAGAHCCGQTYIHLYHIDPQAIRIQDIYQLALDPLKSLSSQFWISLDEAGRVILFYDGLPMDAPGYSELSETLIIEWSATLQPGSWEYFADANGVPRFLVPTNQSPAFYRLRRE